MNSKTFFLIVAGSTIAASILPSLITQLNWLQPSGLGTAEQRKRWLVLSWLIVIFILFGLWLYATNHKVKI